MKVGDKVRNKKDGTIGEVAWSSFGFSIHWRTEKGFHKTLGTSAEEILQYWELIEDDEKVD
jgi:hypothetical protein